MIFGKFGIFDDIRKNSSRKKFAVLCVCPQLVLTGTRVAVRVHKPVNSSFDVLFRNCTKLAAVPSFKCGHLISVRSSGGKFAQGVPVTRFVHWEAGGSSACDLHTLSSFNFKMMPIGDSLTLPAATDCVRRFSLMDGFRMFALDFAGDDTAMTSVALRERMSISRPARHCLHISSVACVKLGTELVDVLEFL